MVDLKWSVIQGDCVDLMSRCPSQFVDCIVTSPPYDSLRDYSGFSLNLDRVGEEAYRVLKDGGMAAVVMQDQTKNFAKSLTSFRTAVDWVDRVGFRLFECVIYARDGNPGAWWNTRFRVDHEYVLLFLKGKRPAFFDNSHIRAPSRSKGRRIHGTDRYTNGQLRPIDDNGKVVQDTKCRGSIWRLPGSSQETPRSCLIGQLKLDHPATFPDSLAEDLIRCFCPEGGIVLDPFSGSGTTVRAAVRSGRRGIGLDISADYCRLSEEMLKAGL